MSQANKELDKPGFFLTHRNLSGAAAADPATLDDADFPPADAFFGHRCTSIWIYWTGTGGVLTETLDLQPLLRDGTNQRWVRNGGLLTLAKDRVVELSIQEAAQNFIRIDAEATAATDIQIRVGMAERAQPE